MTSVLDAVRGNSTRILQLLIAIPGSVRGKELDRALLQAAKLGYSECAYHLINAGADPDTQDACSNTPLKIAVENGHVDVLKVLIAAKCDINQRSNSGSTALHHAARRGRDDCIEILLVAGANTDIQDSSGNTPLIYAAKHSQIWAMKKLLAAKCDVNKQNKEGRAALHYAAGSAMGVELLLKSGADPDIQDPAGNTPLIIAATEGFCNVISLLCDYKCDVNICNVEQQRCAIHYVAMKGHVECVETLLYSGAHPDMPDKDGSTPLWHAINRNQINIVKLLLRSNCGFSLSINNKGQDQNTNSLLKLALEKGHPEIIKMLVITGCDSHKLYVWLMAGVFEPALQVNRGLWDWLDNMSQTPNTLRQLARLSIRHSMGHEVVRLIEYLSLPKAIKDYIALKELDDYH